VLMIAASSCLALVAQPSAGSASGISGVSPIGPSPPKSPEYVQVYFSAAPDGPDIEISERSVSDCGGGNNCWVDFAHNPNTYKCHWIETCCLHAFLICFETHWSPL
jgi:hypothetical protein